METIKIKYHDPDVLRIDKIKKGTTMQKKLLSLVLMLIAAINIFAYDFESNGIYYKILSKENRTCTVTSQPNTTGKKYTGSIVIPSTVQDNNGEDYTVTGIGDYAFMDCVKLQSIVLPNTIQEVGYSAFQGCIQRPLNNYKQ